MILIYTVCKNKTEAKKIAAMLLKLKLIACANWWPIESIYRWKDKVVDDKEAAMILKTRKNYYKKIESVIKKIHSYEMPCIIKLSVDQVEKKYKDWLVQETRIV
ncbi:divalent-cation tolerance protein CutA [Patescibacteria group bacterium]|nr:divalent-cation tolerance protein CutA [Patescibacteria group bacterium]